MQYGSRVGVEFRSRQRSIDVKQDVAQKVRLDTGKDFALARNAEDTFERRHKRNDREDRATVIQAGNGRIRSSVVDRMLGERAVWVKALAVQHAELAESRRRARSLARAATAGASETGKERRLRAEGWRPIAAAGSGA